MSDTSYNSNRTISEYLVNHHHQCGNQKVNIAQSYIILLLDSLPVNKENIELCIETRKQNKKHNTITLQTI